MKTTYFKQRQLAREVSTVEEPECREKLPRGWSKRAPDPMKLVEGFRRLEVKEGFVLKAYQYHSSGNGNGIVWALPKGAPFPPPGKCEKLKDHFLEAPKPPDALDDFMEVITGDGTPESYLAASFMRRELWELGAMWHGCGWSTHGILYKNPISPKEDRTDDPARGYFAEWKWMVKRPVKWLPRVMISKKKATVDFFTFSGHNVEQVLKHTDTYRPGSLIFDTKTTEIARGGSGYIF